MSTIPDSNTFVSWSRVQAHEQCAQKASLLSAHKNPARDSRNMLAGNTCDRAMKAWLSQEDPQPGFMANYAVEAMNEVVTESVEKEDGIIRWRNKSDRQEILDFSVQVLNDLEEILYDKIIPYEYEVAKRFKTTMVVPYITGEPVQIHLVGEFDLLLKRDDTFRVWDLKATKDNYYWKKSLGQLIFYDLAVQAKYGVKTSEVGFIQPACKEKVLLFNIDVEERRQIVSRILQYCNSVWRKEAIPKETKLSDCSMCPVTHSCIKFKSYVDSKGKHRIPFRLVGDLDVSN